MTFRLAVLTLALLPSAVSCAWAGAESRYGARTAREWVDALAVGDTWKMSEAMTSLESDDWEAANDAGSLRGKLGEPARGTLMADLAHSRPQVRIAAISALGLGDRDCAGVGQGRG